MKSLIASILLSFSLVTFFACNSSGGKSGSSILSEEDARRVRSPVSSTLSLRLGQTSDSSSNVAVSAALENGESITIFTNSDGEVGEFDVLYQSATGEALLVTFDSSGRPITSETSDAFVSFENYTSTAVDVTLQAGGSSRFFPEQSIDLSVVTFLEGDVLLEVLLGINQDIDSGTRSLLTFAFSSLRLVGCIAEGLISSFSSFESFVPEIFQSLGDNVCQSELLESVSEVVEMSDYEEITVTDIEIADECRGPRTFDGRKMCARGFGEDTVMAAQERFVGNIQEITAPPIPLNATVARWSGLAIPDPNPHQCVTFDVNFQVINRGDPSCRLPDCILQGRLDERSGPNFLDVMGNVRRSPNTNMSRGIFGGADASIDVQLQADLRRRDGVGVGRYVFRHLDQVGPDCIGRLELRRISPLPQ